MATQAWWGDDLYAVLGIAHDADGDTVRRAYRRQARRHHPDVNAGSPASARRFQRIGEAYAVLSDPGQRRQYDRQVTAMSAGSHRRHASTGSRPAGQPGRGGDSASPPGPGSPGSSGPSPGVEDLLGAWSLAWWAPLTRPPTWWVQVWWTPLWTPFPPRG